MKILLADDHPLFREGVKPVLAKLGPDVRIIEAKDYHAAFEVARADGGIDLALMDLYMPGMDGVEGIAHFRETFPDIPVVVLSAAEQLEDIQSLLGCGALGYITKSSASDTLLGALRLVLTGGVYVPPALLASHPHIPYGGEGHNRYAGLTDRQLDVLRELAKGQTNRQIAAALEVTEGTVKIHLAAIFRLLNVNNRTEAVLAAQRMGLGHGSS